MSLPNQNSISTPEAINILEYYLIARLQSKIPDISIISFIALFSPNWDSVEIHRVHLVISLYLVFSLLELVSSEVKLTFSFNASILNVHLMSFIHTHTHTHTHTYIYTLKTITTSKYRKCSLMPTLQPTTPSPPCPSQPLVRLFFYHYRQLCLVKNFINPIIWICFFCVWLLLLSIFLRIICLIVYMRNWFIFIDG